MIVNRNICHGDKQQQQKMANEFQFKTLVIGEPGTGKSSVIQRYVQDIYKPNYLYTIGVDFSEKVVTASNGNRARLQLWDIAGQERFNALTRVYYKEARACILVFDVTRKITFDAVSKWKLDLDSKVQLQDGNPIPCILLANKCDLDKSKYCVSDEELDRYCAKNNIIKWFHTSAKENINIDMAIRALVDNVLTSQRLTTTPHTDTVMLYDSSDTEQDKNKGISCFGFRISW